ncbi:FUSC family protein [Adhaeribacter soli]|uniref:FUSC family protein n=1 Tax=Adhaeribacter soli TaxID=2607655 RepID=A0A5N1IJR9_9BACT|nr:FUSC family protein [Adhaeribacter soli]KAA9325658.1 FUSC family protein [Adhaeribacter soli]
MPNKLLRYCCNSDLVIYCVRCIIGFLIGYELYLHFPQYELFWTIISIILVISPEEKDARRLTGERFKANLIGSSVGLVCYILLVRQVYMILLGIILTSLICHFFKLMNVARTAVVALFIVVIHEQSELSYWVAVERFASVALGCLIGLSVTYVTGFIIRFIKDKLNIE